MSNKSKVRTFKNLNSFDFYWSEKVGGPGAYSSQLNDVIEDNLNHSNTEYSLLLALNSIFNF